MLGGSGDVDAEHSDQNAELPALAALRGLVEQALAGDTTTLARLRQLLDEQPEIWHHLGDLAARVEDAWLGLLAADHPLMVEALKRTAQEMTTDLLGENPTRLERLLVDQVVSCWLEARYAEAQAVRPASSGVDQAGRRLRHEESAKRRLQESVKTLTALRALLPTGSSQPPAPRLYDSEAPAKTEERKTAGTGQSLITQPASEGG
jgi:hypothetical protein